ncbi:MAG: agmatine deiminase family protein [Candidatus Kapaibacterium sp.]|nr:T9SS type A sorting domain-containing protein [Bacteroidota bacterium]
MKSNSTDSLQMLRLPAEFEETKAVVVQWPYIIKDSLGKEIQPITNEFAFGIDENDGPKIVYIAEKHPITTQYPESHFLASIVSEIQNIVPVRICVLNAKDTIIIKQFFNSIGIKLINYTFMINENINNSWLREFGPIFYYFGEKDSIGIIDTETDAFSISDTKFPTWLANNLNMQKKQSSIEQYSSDIMTDGWGKLICSNEFINKNIDSFGTIHIYKDINSGELTFDDKPLFKEPLTYKQIMDSISLLYNLIGKPIFTLSNKCIGQPSSNVDRFLKFVDDETIVYSDYRSVFKSQNDFPDLDLIDSSLEALRKEVSIYNKPFRLVPLPIPTDDNGLYTKKKCYEYKYDPRSFIQSLIVNTTVFIPIFSANGSGDSNITNSAIRIYKNLLPGYKVVPIDARLITAHQVGNFPHFYGGTIREYIIQIPADNPIHFKHSPLRGVLPPMEKFPIITSIYNNSGIQNTKLYWRKTGNTDWNIKIMERNNLEFQSYIDGNINATNETIEYFIEATSNNGKVRAYPMSAPDGFFAFSYGSTVNLSDSPINSSLFVQCLPNPSSQNTVLNFNTINSDCVTFEILDNLGKECKKLELKNLSEGLHYETLQCDNLQSGLYFIRMIVNNITVATTQLVLIH